MSCIPDGFEALCGHDETIAVREMEETAKAVISSFLAKMNHSTGGTSCSVQSKDLVRDRCIFSNESEDDDSRSVQNAEALHRRELALVEEGPEEDTVMHDDSTVLVHHIDEKSKVKTRAQELEELRQMSLASQNAVKINSRDSDVPTDMDTFQRQQRALNEEHRKNQKLALDGLHAYRADDQQVLDEIRRATLLKVYRGQNDLATSFFSTMTDFGSFDKLQKEIVELKRKRFGGGSTLELNDEDMVATVSQKWHVDVALIQAMFDAKRTDMDNSTVTLTESPQSSPSQNVCCAIPIPDCLENVSRHVPFFPESLPGQDAEGGNRKEKTAKEPTELSEVDKDQTEPQSTNMTSEESNQVFDEVTISVNTPEKSLLATPMAISTSINSKSKAPATPDGFFEDGQRTVFFAKEEQPPVVLKNVPLYFRQPSIEITSVPSSGKEIITCSSKYIPNLHAKRDACERCLFWASAEEKARFIETGHHLRIMMVRGGCGADCSVFPRQLDEHPVRLCKKCYFDTHKMSNEFCSQEELRLLWNNSYDKWCPTQRSPRS